MAGILFADWAQLVCCSVPHPPNSSVAHGPNTAVVELFGAGEEEDIFSEQLRWPHWEGYEARRQLMEKLLKPDKKDRSIEN